MCLATRQKRAKRITEDLIVYKIFDQVTTWSARSSYQEFEYTRGTTYKTKLGISRKGNKDFVNLAFADKVAHKKYGDLRDCIRNDDIIFLSEGFHSCTNEERAQSLMDGFYYKIIECVIPAGSKIYFDETGLVVSDKIIIG